MLKWKKTKMEEIAPVGENSHFAIAFDNSAVYGLNPWALMLRVVNERGRFVGYFTSVSVCKMIADSLINGFNDCRVQ